MELTSALYCPVAKPPQSSAIQEAKMWQNGFVNFAWRSDSDENNFIDIED